MGGRETVTLCEVEVEYPSGFRAWVDPKTAQEIVQRGEARLTGRGRRQVPSPDNKAIVPEYPRHGEVR